MKFDFAIGNPPYQEDRQGESNTALPVYHHFIDEVMKISNAAELITPARFLFDAGRTPKNFNRKMLDNEHFKVLVYESNASLVFQNTEIKGGVAITYYDRKKLFSPIKIFTQHDELNGIVQKVISVTEENQFLNSICFVATKFNTNNLFHDYPQYTGHERRMSSNVLSLPCFHSTCSENDIMVLGVLNGKRAKMYINKDYVDCSDDVLFKYKIAMPKADGNGVFGETLTAPEIIESQCGFTHTFLGLGNFENVNEAHAALKYIKTKFARTLLSVLKVTQDVNAEKWKYVPLQNFTADSDIDWSTSIRNIDRQLYKKYNLTEEEIDFIESHVKEME